MQQKQTQNDKDPSGYWNTMSIQNFDHSDLNEAMLTNQWWHRATRRAVTENKQTPNQADSGSC
jgi:hypothetical protein